MLYINIIVLLALSFASGYFMGKGKIVIERKLDKTTSENIIRKQEQAVERYNNMMQELTGGGDIE